jgi:hypothetical protein
VNGNVNVDAECPVCISRNIKRTLRVTSAEAARNCLHPRRERDRYEALRRHIAALWGRDHCYICRCGNCGFGFSDPYIAGDPLFYNTAYDRKEGEYPVQKWEYLVAKTTIAARVATNGQKNVRLLEIGAGSGAFLTQIVPRLIRSDAVLCTEYSEYGAAQIRGLGIRVEQADIRISDTSSHEPFDIVCMFQVLEHMDRIPQLFAKLRVITSVHADLLIAVPNTRRNQFNEDNGAVLDMPPNHIGRWTKSSFEALAKREGWRMTQYLEEPTNALRSWQIFSTYRYARASQLDDRLSARIRGLPRGVLSRCLEVSTVAAFALRSLPHLPKLLSAGMGESVFVQLRRDT